MDLGRARLRKVGINNLHCAVHPRHGVVWSDGKSIYLAPIKVEGHHVRNAESVKLGEFEHVSGVKWSNITDGESCHMCVVHQNNVTVWRVSGDLPKLSFKQVRKINVHPVPQGCLWNPCSDILCLLSRHQCSFYFRHDSNKGSYAFPALESGSIACGCWSPDGTKLVLCVGAALLIYRWPNVQAAVDDFAATAWRVPGLEGKLVSIAPVLKDSVVVAAEIPIESLCKQPDLFKVPDSDGDGQPNSDDIIRPNKAASFTESLLNLQHNTQAAPEASSSLTLLHLHDGSHDPVKLSTVALKGVIAPDILMYEKSSQCVIVGSNIQSQLHIYALLEKHLAYCGNIQLDKEQRPKGLCSMPTHFDERGAALLVLVGQRELEESGLLAPSSESEFKLSLKYIILRAGHGHRTKQVHSGDSLKERPGRMKTSHQTKPGSTKPHHVKQLSDPSIKEWADLGQNNHKALSHTNSAEAQIKLPVSGTEEESEKLRTQPHSDAANQEKIIEDLSKSSSPNNRLEVDRVPFAAKVPSFNNSKLNAVYELSPASNGRLETQTDSPDGSRSQNIHNAEVVDGNTVKPNAAQRLNLNISRSFQSQPTLGKYTNTERTMGEFVAQQDQGIIARDVIVTSGSSKEDASSDVGEVIVSQTKGTVSQATLASKQAASPNVNLDSVSWPENEVSQATPPSKQATTPGVLPGPDCTFLPKGTLPQTTPTSSQLKSPGVSAIPDSVSPPEFTHLQTTATSTQAKSPDIFPSPDSGIISPTNFISPQTDALSPSLHSSIQSDEQPQISSPTSTKIHTESPKNVSSTSHDAKLETASTCPQTKHFSSVSPDARLPTLSSSSQIVTESPKQFSSFQDKTVLSYSQVDEKSAMHLSSLQANSSQSNTESSKNFYSLPVDLQAGSSGGRVDLSELAGPRRAQDVDHSREDAFSDAGLGSSQYSVDSTWEVFERQIKSQKESIDALHRRLESLSVTVDKTCCVFPNRYQDMSCPEMVEIYCEKPEGTKTKRFLLDNGRLQLEPVKLAFGLSTVEIWLDGVSCVLGANVDGYIPMKFPPSTKLHISGRPADTHSL